MDGEDALGGLGERSRTRDVVDGGERPGVGTGQTNSHDASSGPAPPSTSNATAAGCAASANATFDPV